MTANQIKQRRACAYHEAGHAIVLLAIGGQIGANDDAQSFFVMRDRTPDGPDRTILERYRLYSEACFSFLGLPIVWDGVTGIAEALLQRCRLSEAEALEAIGYEKYPLQAAYGELIADLVPKIK